MSGTRARFVVFALFAAGCSPASRAYGDANPTDTTPAPAAAAPGELLSAFWGLDNGLPSRASRAICSGASGQDGLPVVFGAELDRSTVQAGDFRVTAASGAVGTLVCVSFAPAIDLGELRTVLLVGEYGATDDPPATVEIVGNVLSADGTTNFDGAVRGVKPLEGGPSLVLAEPEPEAQWKARLGKAGSWADGSGCPAEGTVQVVRATWSAGVMPHDGEEAGEAERTAYAVGLAVGEGSPDMVAPIALADLGDGDNNHNLCLGQAGTPISVSFAEGLLVDPNGDVNNATRVSIGAPAAP